MKTVKFLLMVMFVASFTSTVSAQRKIDPAGTWAYEAPQAPYEYSTGDLVVAKEGQDYTAKMILGGYETIAEKVVYEENELSFEIYVEAETVKIKLTVEKEAMNGTASYSEGTITITAKKKE